MHSVYDSHTSHSLPNPFDGVDALVFVLLGFEAGNSALAPFVDGYGRLQISADCAGFLSGVGQYTCTYTSLNGVILNWGSNKMAEFRLAHEWGHLLNLYHTATSSPAASSYNSDTYFFGVYSSERGEDIPGQGFLPYHPIDLMSEDDLSPWVPPEPGCPPGPAIPRNLGWYPNPVSVTTNLKNQAVWDIRRPEGLVYRIDLPPFEMRMGEIVTYAPQCFLIAYHAQTNEDGELNAGGTPLYPSRGLAIWHVVSTFFWDLESARGRFAGPVAPECAPSWSTPDVDDGFDELDVWPVPPGCPNTNGLRPYDEMHHHPGSPEDFFNLDRPEFSFRTNPNSYGHAPFVVGEDEWVRRLPESVESSIMIRVKEDHGDHLVVDILLAPYENLTSPNGGEVFAVEEPIPITWEVDPTLDINLVDIEFSADGDGRHGRPGDGCAIVERGSCRPQRSAVLATRGHFLATALCQRAD